jgi:hypothetical protein
MPIISPEDNFADLREATNNLLKTTSDENVKQLVGLVGRLAYRCDLLEREVEKIGRTAGKKAD